MLTVHARLSLGIVSLAVACHAVSTERGLGATCSAEAVCASDLECVAERCRVQCVEDVECETSCVTIDGEGGKYCALAGERGSDQDGGVLPGGDAGLGGTPAVGGSDTGGVGGISSAAGSGGALDAGTTVAGSGGVPVAGAGGRGGAAGAGEAPDAAAGGGDAGDPGCDVSQVGLRCGTCGTFACEDDELTCTGDVVNECGGCAALTGEVGDRCGTCGTAQCAGANFLNCVGDHPLNACNGCGTLVDAPGQSCGTCGADEFICDGLNATRCDGDSTNACGGCSTLADRPGEPCDSCFLNEDLELERGEYFCTSEETTACSGALLCPE